MQHLQFPTPDHALRALAEKFLDGLPTNGTTGIRWWTNDIVIEIEEPINNIDLTQVGFNFRRWRKFLGEYVEPVTFLGWINRLKDSRDSQEISYTCHTGADHSLGNCLLGLTVNDDRVTMFSRSSNLIPTAALDLSFGALVCMEVARVRRQRRPLRLVWHVAQLQFHIWTCLPYLAYAGLLPEEYPQDGLIVAQEVYRTKHRVITNTYPKTFRSYRRAAEKTKALLASPVREVPYHPEFPGSYTNSNILRDGDVLTPDKLTIELGVTRKDIRYILRPYREVVSSVGIPTFRSYDLVWNRDHPEMRAMRWCIANKRKIKALPELLTAVGVKDVDELRALYQKFEGGQEE